MAKHGRPMDAKLFIMAEISFYKSYVIPTMGSMSSFLGLVEVSDVLPVILLFSLLPATD